MVPLKRLNVNGPIREKLLGVTLSALRNLLPKKREA